MLPEVEISQSQRRGNIIFEVNILQKYLVPSSSGDIGSYMLGREIIKGEKRKYEIKEIKDLMEIGEKLLKIF